MNRRRCQKFLTSGRYNLKLDTKQYSFQKSHNVVNNLEIICRILEAIQWRKKLGAFRHNVHKIKTSFHVATTETKQPTGYGIPGVFQAQQYFVLKIALCNNIFPKYTSQWNCVVILSVLKTLYKNYILQNHSFSSSQDQRYGGIAL